MAVPVAAWDEEHRNRTDARNEKGIMVSTADHSPEPEPMFFARSGKRLDDFDGAIGRRIGV
jgi:hypothetical protein